MTYSWKTSKKWFVLFFFSLRDNTKPLLHPMPSTEHLQCFFSTLIATFPTYLPQCGFASFWNIVLLFVSFSFCFVLMTFANFPFFIYIFYTVFRFLTAVFCANICLVVGALIRNQSSNGIILLLSSTSPPIYLFW